MTDPDNTLPTPMPPYNPPDSLAPPTDPIAGGSALDTQYTNYGTVKTEAQIAEDGDAADHGPQGMPAASPDDAPFSETTIPNGWSRFPTAEEVAYLNAKYPTP
jgi:hypothetical protein